MEPLVVCVPAIRNITHGRNRAAVCHAAMAAYLHGHWPSSSGLLSCPSAELCATTSCKKLHSATMHARPTTPCQSAHAAAVRRQVWGGQVPVVPAGAKAERAAWSAAARGQAGAAATCWAANMHTSKSTPHKAPSIKSSSRPAPQPIAAAMAHHHSSPAAAPAVYEHHRGASGPPILLPHQPAGQARRGTRVAGQLRYHRRAAAAAAARCRRRPPPGAPPARMLTCIRRYT